MKIVETNFKGLYIIQNNKIEDERGWFRKTYHEAMLKTIVTKIGETYVSLSKKGVLRGLHFQKGNAAQSKLITCLAGSFIDVAIDLRRNEPSFGQVFFQELNSGDGQSIYVPSEFAHGVYTTQDNTILLNQAGNVYSPGDEGGINWRSVKELRFIKDPIVSEKDNGLDNLENVLNNI